VFRFPGFPRSSATATRKHENHHPRTTLPPLPFPSHLDCSWNRTMTGSHAMASFLSSLPTFADVRSDNHAILPHRRVLILSSPSTAPNNCTGHQRHPSRTSSFPRHPSRWEDGQSQPPCGCEARRKIECAPRLPSRPTSCARSAGAGVLRPAGNGPRVSVQRQPKTAQEAIEMKDQIRNRTTTTTTKPSRISTLPMKPRRRLSNESCDRHYARSSASPPTACRIGGDWSSSPASVTRKLDDLHLHASWTSSSSTISSCSPLVDGSVEAA
jgi:hypothetical protein